MTDRLVAGLRCSEASDLAAGFVLGALDPAEMAAVRAHLGACPEAHAKFAEIGSVVPALLESVEPVEPSPALGARILAAARAERPPAAPTTPEPASAAPAPRGRVPIAGSAFRLRLLRGGRRPAWAALGIAAALAIAILGSLTLQLRSERDELAAYGAGVAAVFDAAAQRGAQLAVLAAPNGSSGAAGIAAVRADGTVTIAMRGLGPTAGSQVYEAWLIASAAAPVPVGAFSVGGSGTGTLTTTSGAAGPGVVVALTLEPGPGATKPTLPLVALGTAQGRPG